MKARNCYCKKIVLLLVVIFMPELPWMYPNFHMKSSGAEALDLTYSKLNKSGDASNAPRVIFHNSDLQMGSTSLILGQWEDNPLCREMIAELANVSASLISCFVQNARPVTVCQNCVEEYIHFYDVYRNICKPTGNEETQKCEDQLLNRDKLNVVKKICNFGSSLWNEGYCTNCFITEDGLVTTHLNNDTKAFIENYDAVKKCFQNHQAYSNKRNGSVCSSCLSNYSVLIKDYGQLQQKYSDAVCMDLTDIINTTRALWGETYNCKKIPASGVYVYLLTTLFAILVAAFYCGFRFIAHAQNIKIIGQTRFVSMHCQDSNSDQQLNSLH